MICESESNSLRLGSVCLTVDSESILHKDRSIRIVTVNSIIRMSTHMDHSVRNSSADSSPDSAIEERREFLLQSAAAIAGFSAAATFEALWARTAWGAFAGSGKGYGDLVPAKDETTGLELLKLPPGFRYVSFGWKGDPLSSGALTPGSHDGMAVIGSKPGQVILCRNHEVSGGGKPLGGSEITYDSNAPGGCINLLFDTKAGKLVKSWAAISGTSRNCAGGPTPWGTWLTCEETVFGPGDKDKDTKKPFDFKQTHGWMFEVPAEGPASPVPLKDMGRFVHEAVAVDPQTGIVYETEDRATAGIYRFLPKEKGKLAQGGKLQMMKVSGQPDLRGGFKQGQTFDTAWVDIADPSLPHSPGTTDEQGVFHQGKKQGGTTFARLEGAWAGDGVIYIVSTNGGKAKKGQVWVYQPREEKLRLVFESPESKVLDFPDNITVSPRGGLVVCEDGDYEPQRLQGLTRDGLLFPLAANNMVLNGEKNKIKGDFRKDEWCGACFSPDGQWLFANLQTPGLTVAITGPWQDGPL